jgi:hypothetical protein
MADIKIAAISQYTKENTNNLNTKRLEYLQNLKLNELLFNENPYIFILQNTLLVSDFIQKIIDEYLSSQEKLFLDNFLVDLAIFINENAYHGQKSTTQGVDLEFNKDKIRYIVAIKSGPNWGNSSQIRKMQDDFRKAKQTIRTSNSKLNIVAVNGCCYGRNTKPDKGDYYKYCGQKFWEFISNNSDLYLKIIKPLGYTAREKNEKFQKEYSQIVNRFTLEFSKTFVKNGEIDWDSLVKFNSEEFK